MLLKTAQDVIVQFFQVWEALIVIAFVVSLVLLLFAKPWGIGYIKKLQNPRTHKGSNSAKSQQKHNLFLFPDYLKG